MSKKGIIVATAAYVAGVAAATFYGKNSKQLKKDLNKAEENGESKFGIVFGAIVDTHMNMINSLKDEILSEKNIKLYNEYKEEVLKIIDNYKEKGKELMLELKDKGADYAEIASEKLEKLYHARMKDLEKIKGLSVDTMTNLKDKLTSTFNSTKEEIKEEAKKAAKKSKEEAKDVKKELKK